MPWIDLHSGGGLLQNECTTFSNNHVGSVLSRASIKHRLEMDSNCRILIIDIEKIALASFWRLRAVSISFDVSIESICCCRSISLRHRWFSWLSSNISKKWLKSIEADRIASCTCRRELVWNMDSIWERWKVPSRSSNVFYLWQRLNDEPRTSLVERLGTRWSFSEVRTVYCSTCSAPCMTTNCHTFSGIDIHTYIRVLSTYKNCMDIVPI